MHFLPPTFKDMFLGSWDRLWRYKIALLVPVSTAFVCSIIFNVGSHFLSEEHIAVALVMTILIFAVMFICSIYGTLIVYDQHMDRRKTLDRSLSMALPYIGLWLWMLVRSYVWIPILILIAFVILNLFHPILSPENPMMTLLATLSILAFVGFSMYYGPRMACSEVIFFTEKRKIKQSVEESIKRTEGQWWFVVWNSILYTVCLMLLGVAVITIGMVSIFVWALLMKLAIDFLRIPEMVMLVLTIVAVIPLIIAFALTQQYVQYWQKAFLFELAKRVFIKRIKIKDKAKN